MESERRAERHGEVKGRWQSLIFGVQVSHVLVCRKISFNCTLIAHENVTTEFFLLLLFGVILFYFILF